MQKLLSTFVHDWSYWSLKKLLGYSHLTLFDLEKEVLKKFGKSFNWLGIPILENLECLSRFLLWKQKSLKNP